MLHQGPIVLLVDDEEDVRQLLARILQDSGIRVVEAENGAAALQLARRLNGSLSLVVTDIDMPVMDGLQFARAFRVMDTRVPFLFITGSADPALLVDRSLDGETLPKPFSVETFLDAVARLAPSITGSGQLM